MKQIILLFIAIATLSCKSPEEKLKEKFLTKSTHFLKEIDGGEISEVGIVKVDTIKEKQELLMIAALLTMSIDKQLNSLSELKSKYDESLIKYKLYGSIDESGFWLKRLNDSYAEYSNLKLNLEILDKKSLELQKKSNQSTSTKVLGYNVNLKFKSKDNYGMVKTEEQSLPFYPDGELRDMRAINNELLKKYNLEYILNYIN